MRSSLQNGRWGEGTSVPAPTLQGFLTLLLVEIFPGFRFRQNRSHSRSPTAAANSSKQHLLVLESPNSKLKSCGMGVSGTGLHRLRRASMWQGQLPGHLPGVEPWPQPCSGSVPAAASAPALYDNALRGRRCTRCLPSLWAHLDRLESLLMKLRKALDGRCMEPGGVAQRLDFLRSSASGSWVPNHSTEHTELLPAKAIEDLKLRSGAWQPVWWHVGPPALHWVAPPPGVAASREPVTHPASLEG